MTNPQASGPLFRVDKFVVPHAALQEFSDIVARTHQVLRGQTGLIREHVLEQISGPGRFNVTTIVEWADQESHDAAAGSVRRFHASIGFDRDAFVRDLGIEADIGVYRNHETA